jgi:NAD(P)-dependent dehydrogenase (short-subunit alcohol dehydrogenase family)
VERIALNDQVVVVTGSGKGLGRAYALELGRRGASVVVNDIPGTDDAEAVVEEIEREGGRAVSSYQDVSTRAGGQAIVDNALDAFGSLHGLVNNAGILRNNLFEDLTDEQIDSVLDVHVKGAFYVTQPAYHVMKENGYGRILNVSSNTAFGLFGLINYATAKAGLFGLTTSLAIEGAEHGVLVNALFPNASSTIMENDPIPGFADDERFMAAFDAVAHNYGPETIGPLVAFLVSPACAVTGEGFSAMAGRYARVFYGHTRGWLSPSGHPSAEEIAEHLDQIRDPEGALIPTSCRDEFEAVAALFGSQAPR